MNERDRDRPQGLVPATSTLRVVRCLGSGKSRSTLPGALALLLSLGCVEFNPECPQLVEDPEAVAGVLAHDVYLDKPNARHANNAFGQAAAEAFRQAIDGAELGLINGGGLRAEGLCETRNVLPAGELTHGALADVMLFNNLVVGLDVTRNELLWVLENSVRGLSREGEPITDPPGAFLHLSSGSGLTRMRVDCSKDPPDDDGREGGAPVDGRVTELIVNGRDVFAAPEDARFRVAMSDYVINYEGGIAHILSTKDDDLSRNPVRGDIDSGIVAAFMEANYDGGSPSARLSVDPDRIAFEGCATPPAP